MKKVILALLSAQALSMPLTAGAADFIRLDGASYDTMWQKGKTIKKHGSLENPMHYGVEMRHGTLGSNQVVLVTPYTAGLYISSTENLRLLDVPADFKDSLLQNQDILFIAPAYVPVHHLISWSMETKGSGRAEHLALVKEGKRIYPRYTVNPAVDSLLPHSHFVRYFGFTRQEILDVPYEVRYVNGEGDLISFKVDEKDLEELIREEKNFKA
ncbi:hypothetical protein [uncultured Dialister sp.]|uniref:hypothetical protein n=1 Tax=uncultured Dialister sp. TaxID=278064 RepID=UPI00266FD62B|nr:hypothetical protein [uncultured Dialister sp.]